MLFVGDEVAVLEPVLEGLGHPAFLADAGAHRAVWLIDAPAVEVVRGRSRRWRSEFVGHGGPSFPVDSLNASRLRLILLTLALSIP